MPSKRVHEIAEMKDLKVGETFWFYKKATKYTVVAIDPAGIVYKSLSSGRMLAESWTDRWPKTKVLLRSN